MKTTIPPILAAARLRAMPWCGKDLFWEPHETVMQLHPPESEWISNHPYCLHLWRHVSREIPMPPSIMVGRQEIGDISKMTEAQRAEVLRKFNAGDYSR